MLIRLSSYVKLKKARKFYEDYYKRNSCVIEALLRYYHGQNQNVAIWGGGLKGIAFLNTFDKKLEYIACVFDIDKNKWKTKIATGHRITNYEESDDKDIEVIMIMNNNYETEIAAKLKENHTILINIDSIIFGMMSYKEVLDLYGRKL